jgi:hypothetical protein
MIVGDPLVARVKRDLKGVNVRGYPVQVSACRTDNSLVLLLTGEVGFNFS